MQIHEIPIKNPLLEGPNPLLEGSWSLQGRIWILQEWILEPPGRIWCPKWWNPVQTQRKSVEPSPNSAEIRGPWSLRRVRLDPIHSMEIHENPWKSIEIPWNSMKIHSMKIHENPWKSIKINENRWKSMEINGNQWQSMKIYGNWKSLKIIGNQWKSMKIFENQ